MKKIILFVILIFSVMLGVACEVSYAVADSSKKESYKNGDELVFEIRIKLVHRNCTVDIADTKFKMVNMKAAGATKWKEESPGYFTRQIKAKIVISNKGDAKFMLERKCDKEGGYGVLTLKTE